MTKILDRAWADRARIFDRIKPSKLDAYQRTQLGLRRSNVATDLAYQRVFKSCYAMGRRSAAWYDFYFNLLEKEKNNQNIRLESVFQNTFDVTGRVEPSFSSKLVATVLPDTPIYDDIVRSHLNIPKPRYDHSAEKRLEAAVFAYNRMTAFYNSALSTELCRDFVSEFDSHFPEYSGFTPIKKIDIILWQYRMDHSEIPAS